MIAPFIIIGQLGVHSDWSFHAARVQQIFLNLKRGHFITYIATDTFSKVGNANFLFYPIVFLYPWALLKFIFAPIIAYLIYIWIILLATGLIAFFCMQHFTKGKTLQSFFFSIIYLIAPYHLYLTFSNYVLGEAIAYSFIPIVLLGIYNFWKEDKWILLAVGLTLMAYSHYVSLFISVELCLIVSICFIIQNQKITYSQVKNLGKAIVLFLVLSLWQFIPLFTDYLGENLSKPASGFYLVQNAGDFIVSAISNEALNKGGIGLLLVVTLFIGWRFVDKNSSYTWIYFLGALFTWIITTAFPWQYFSKTPLSIVQFPYRYTSYAIVFLAMILSKMLANINKINKTKYLSSLGIILMMLLLYAGSVYPDLARNARIDKRIPILINSCTGNYKTFRDPNDSPIIIDNDNYNKQFSYGALFGETDYIPQKAVDNNKSVFNRQTYINGKKAELHQQTFANKILYNVKVTTKKSVIDIPQLSYRHTRVKVDGKNYAYGISNRGTILLSLNRGAHTIEISYHPSLMLTIFRIVAVIGWLGILINYSYRRLVK